MLSGLPASGKSTYAEELVKTGGNWVRVNKDSLRTMLHFDKFTHNNEALTQQVEVAIAIEALKNGYNVVVDDTNLGEKHRNLWSGLAKDEGHTFEQMNFDADAETCLYRDLLRERKIGKKSVGRAVIMNMAMQYNLLTDYKNLVIVDIDGTVADCDHRRHFVQGEKKDWKSFFEAMGLDIPRKVVYNRAHELAVANGAEIVFVSARPEDYREVTESWLRDNEMDHLHLIMRPSGDSRPDTEVKAGIYNKYLKHYNIIKVFDDRPRILDFWERTLGKDRVVDVGSNDNFIEERKELDRWMTI